MWKLENRMNIQKKGKGFTSIKGCVVIYKAFCFDVGLGRMQGTLRFFLDATVQRFIEYTKQSKEEHINAVINNNINRIKRTNKKSHKQIRTKNNCLDTSNDKIKKKIKKYDKEVET